MTKVDKPYIYPLGTVNVRRKTQGHSGPVEILVRFSSNWAQTKFLIFAVYFLLINSCWSSCHYNKGWMPEVCCTYVDISCTIQAMRGIGIIKPVENWKPEQHQHLCILCYWHTHTVCTQIHLINKQVPPQCLHKPANKTKTHNWFWLNLLRATNHVVIVTMP